jgi:hypothetical protein
VAQVAEEMQLQVEQAVLELLILVVEAVDQEVGLTQEVLAAQVSLSLDTPRRREIFTAGNGHVDEVVLLLA